jgi:glycosyltransferase involved in cell wall biosynthesis
MNIEGAKVKVLHIVGDSKYGGGALVIQRLAEMAKTQGWEVDILTTDPKFQEVLRDIEVGVVDLDVIWRDIRPWKDFCGMLRLYRFLKDSDYTLIHTHTSKAGLVGRLASWLARRRVIIHTVHGFAFHENSSQRQLQFYSFLERLAAHWCTHVVTVSEFHRDWAIRLHIADRDKITAIPNGIPADRIVSEVSPEAVKVSLGLSADEVMVLAAGRLAEQKGLEYLLKAVALLKTEITSPFRIVLAGEGPLKTDLEGLSQRLGIQDNVLFLGFRDDIDNLVSACDVIAMPSLWEGLSISLLEGMAAGKPVITTTIGSNREVTRNGEGAVLVPTKDENALASALKEMIDDPSQARQVAAKAKEIFYENYSEERMISQYRDLYMKLLHSV